MKKTIVSEDTVQRVVELYKTTIMSEISKIINLPYGIVQRIIKEQHLPVKPTSEVQKISHRRKEVINNMRRSCDERIDIKEAIELYVNQKWSMKDVAERYKVEPRVLTLRFKERKIEIRGNKEAQQISGRRPEIREKISVLRRLSVEYLQRVHPFFCKVEEIRKEPGGTRVQVHCKNHNCPNSKEMGGWFTPTGAEIQNRNDALTKPNGSDASYMYCSEECKNSCSLYGKSVVTLMKLDEIRAGHIKEPPYTEEEYYVFLNEVRRRNIEIYETLTCELCGNTKQKDLIVHHEKPKKTHPHLALDPDNGWVLCGFKSENKCHLHIGHSDKDCTTGHLASLVCF